MTDVAATQSTESTQSSESAESTIGGGAPDAAVDGPVDGPVAGGPVGAGGRLLAAARLAAPAIGLYLGLRAISLDVLAAILVYARPREPGRLVYWDGSTDTWRGYRAITDVLLSWDGRWYSLLAAEGYPDLAGSDEHGIPYTHRLAFFPLYPLLARPFTLLPGVSGGTACMIVSFVSSIAAAWGLFAIGNLIKDRRFGIMFAALWAVAPVCMAQNGAFTESLFTALSAWSLYAVLTRRWLVAGALCGLAGACRPNAMALAAAIGVSALIAVVRRRDGWRPYVGTALAPLGYVAVILYAGSRLGNVTGFFELQRNYWDAYFDYGKSTVEYIGTAMLTHEPYNNHVFLLTALVVVLYGLLILLAAVDRAPLPLMVFAVVLFIGSAGSHGKFSFLDRHMMPIFPALIVPAAGLAKAKFRTQVVLLPALAVLSGWYGGWLPFGSGHLI